MGDRGRGNGREREIACRQFAGRDVCVLSTVTGKQGRIQDRNSVVGAGGYFVFRFPFCLALFPLPYGSMPVVKMLEREEDNICLFIRAFVLLFDFLP